MFWKRRDRTEELLERIAGLQQDHSIFLHNINELLRQQTTVLSKCVDKLTRPSRPTTEASLLDDAICEMRKTVEAIKGEPFMALHSWISEANKREERHEKLVKSLLDRWKNQVDEMRSVSP